MKARNMISKKAATFSIWGLTTLGIAILLLTFAGSIGPNVVSAQQTSACATGGAVPDPDNNPGLVSDCGALLAARDTLAGTATLNWAADTPMSEWEGVTTDGTPLRVTQLNLSRKGLTGEIPAQLGNLSNLTQLNLRSNQLTGDIPAELGNLSNLTFLGLYNNQLTRELPQSLTGLTMLEWLIFYNNSELCAPTDEAFQTWLESIATVRGSSCALVDWPGDRTVLIELYSATDGANWTNNTNWLSDRPIREWHGVTNDANGRVTGLYLPRNQLSGEIPTELGNLSNLEALILAVNQLTGELPQSLTGLTMLQWLFFGSNAGLCAPTDEPFQTWLQSIDNWSGEFCAVEDSPEDRAVLVALYNATDGDNWTNNTNWLSDEPMRDWHGVTTDVDGRVTVLDVGDNQLTGDIPLGLGTLSNLTELWLGTNQLMGEIPTELGDISNLTMLDLGDNQLTGEIPTELGDLSNLRELWLDNNRLMEEIPNELSDLSKLTRLELGGNDLTGEILPGLGDLSNLTHLSLGENELIGEIPADLGDLTNLVWLWLSDNQLTGELPQSLTGLTMLQWLFFGSNAGLCAPTDKPFQTWLQSIDNWSGEFCAVEDSPEDRAVLVALYNATDGDNWTNNTNWLSDEPMRDWHGVTTDVDGRVAGLSLSENQLRGKIPTKLGDLPNLTRLFLGFNQLTGEIPADLGNLASLERLYLGGNRIGGRIPPELGDLTNLTELWLGDGLNLTGEIPSELSRLIRLEVLDLGDGAMNGAIPAWLGDLTGLQKLYLDGNRFAGQVPAELGNLSHLELLTLDGNAGLLGALPQTLTGVTGLHRLTFHDTGLCAPLDESFQAWLRNIPEHEGPNCLPEPPAGTTERVIFRDVFGREVNETGLVLVDWEGHIANPAMKYFVELPGATATLSSGEPRLYFDLPSWAGPNGPTKALVSEGPTQAAEFHISIFPDRDTSDESHTLTIRYVVGGGRVSSQSIDVHVIDQDVDRPLEFNVIAEFRNDESGMFDDPAAREAVQQAADDWAYFIADMDLDEVLAGEELMWGPDNVRLRNAIDYTGILIGAYGHPNSEMTATGGPTCGGQNHSSSGVELPIKRSGNIEFDPRGLFDTLGWIISLDEDEWWMHGVVEMGDLYPVAIHEIGHALVFSSCQDGFAGFHEAGEVRDDEVRDYYGSYPRTDHYHHFIDGTNDPISKRGAFGNEWDGETPDGRWLVTKLHLLVAQAVGYTLRDTSPFRELSLLDEPLVEGSAGVLYTHTLNVVGGIPAYYWTIEKGALPDGLSLDSFTGTISGTPQKPGTFDFTIRVQDSTEGSLGVIRAVSLNIRDRVHYTSDGEVLVELYNATDGANWTNNTNWLSDEPIGEWYGVTTDNEGRVAELSLSDNHLTGDIPAALGNLTKLARLNLSGNQFTGCIPDEVLSLLDTTDNDLEALGLVFDCGVLLAARDTLAGSGLLNWSSDTPITDWDGVTVSGTPKRVTGLILRRMSQLDGTIPAVLGRLSGLENLSLYANALTGEIPAELADLSSLKLMYINNNRLSGTIPPELGTMTNLERLWLHRNNLTGGIPASLGGLSSLESLSVYGNDLSGEIPAKLAKLTNLKVLYLHANQLSGSIPASLGRMSNLRLLYLYSNQLTGTIPDALGDLSNLRVLSLGRNRLTGGIPGALGNLSNLERLYLHNQSLGGPIPDALGELTKLTTLVLQHAELTGPIPSALGRMTSLEWLNLQNNRLTGPIPPVLGGLTKLQRLYLHFNQLTGPIPKDLGDLSTLTNLWLNDNDLSGVIPKDLDKLTNLVRWRLRNNSFEGCVPTGLAAVENSDLASLGLPTCSGP